MAATSRSAGIDSSMGYFFGSARCVVATAALCTTRTAEGKLLRTTLRWWREYKTA